MNYRKYILFCFIIINQLILNSLAWSQNVKVSAAIDSSTIRIGDQIWLSVSIDKLKKENVKWPVFKDTLVAGIEVLDVSKIDTQFVDNKRMVLSQKYLITAFEEKDFVIPPIGFIHNSDTLYTNALFLSVRNIVLDSLEKARIDTSQVFDVFDIKPPIDTPWTIKEFLQLNYPYIIGLILFIAIVVLISIYLKRRKKNLPLIKLPEKPKEPAHIIAFRALDVLKTKKLWQNGYEKEYYLELTDIIREYIQERYKILTFERTTLELLESINNLRVMELSVFDELRNFLTLADLAKFAKYKPLPNDNDKCLKDAYHFVEATKLEEPSELKQENITETLQSEKIQDKS